MVLLSQPAPTLLAPSKSTPSLPAIGKSPAFGTARAPPLSGLLLPSEGSPSHSRSPLVHDQPLGLGPADRSLLPQQQKQRRNKHISCQTDSTELADLRTLQEQLVSVKEELTAVNTELVHAERRLRHEVREEMEERVRKFEKRTMDKVAYLRARQESSVSTMRKASRAQLESFKAQTEGSLRQEHESVRTGELAALEQMSTRLEQQELLIAGYKRENRELRERVELLRGSTSSAPTMKKQSSLDVAEQTAQLTAQLAQRDATIKALRDQLARVQHGLPATPAEQQREAGLANSQSVPAVGAERPGGAPKTPLTQGRSSSRGKSK
jgi:hypothetical protein